VKGACRFWCLSMRPTNRMLQRMKDKTKVVMFLNESYKISSYYSFVSNIILHNIVSILSSSSFYMHRLMASVTTAVLLPEIVSMVVSIFVWQPTLFTSGTTFLIEKNQSIDLESEIRLSRMLNGVM